MNKKEYIKKYYGQAWLNKPKRNEEFQHYTLAHELIDFNKIETCFSIGIGDGVPLEQYYSNFCKVEGVDMSEDCVIEANKLDNITATVADIAEYSIGKYDLVVALRCLFFIDEWRRVLKESLISAQKYLLFDVINKDNKWISEIESGHKNPLGRAIIALKDLIKIAIGKKYRIQKYRNDILHSHGELTNVLSKMLNIKKINFYGIVSKKIGYIDNDKDYRIIYIIEKE